VGRVASFQDPVRPSGAETPRLISYQNFLIAWINGDDTARNVHALLYSADSLEEIWQNGDVGFVKFREFQVFVVFL